MRWLFNPAVVGALVVAGLTSGGQYVNNHYLVTGPLGAPLEQEAIVFGALGLYLGWRKRQAALGAFVGCIVGALYCLFVYLPDSHGWIGFGFTLILATVPLVLVAIMQAAFDGAVSFPAVLARGVMSTILANLVCFALSFRMFPILPTDQLASFVFVPMMAASGLALHVLIKR